MSDAQRVAAKFLLINVRRVQGRETLCRILSDKHEFAAVTNAGHIRDLVLPCLKEGGLTWSEVREGFSADRTL